MSASDQNRRRTLEENRLLAFYTKDNKYVGLKTAQNNYKIFRLEDGQQMCTIDSADTEICFSLSSGGFITAIGLIDIRTRQCHPWSIESCLHFSRNDIHLFASDVPHEEMSKDLKILGLPMPAFFPKFYYRFAFSSTQAEKQKMS